MLIEFFPSQAWILGRDRDENGSWAAHGLNLALDSRFRNGLVPLSSVVCQCQPTKKASRSRSTRVQ